MQHTLIIARRALTVPKTALAGVMLETSFARFIASMATFSEEIVPPRSFGRWDIASMIDAPNSSGCGGRCGRCDGGSSQR